MLGQLVGYRVEHGLAIIELNHPPANTYSYALMVIVGPFGPYLGAERSL